MNASDGIPGGRTHGATSHLCGGAVGGASGWRTSLAHDGYAVAAFGERANRLAAGDNGNATEAGEAF